MTNFPKVITEMPRKVRPVTICDDHAIVNLTAGKVAVIDISDVDLIAPWNWRLYTAKNPDGSTRGFYAARTAWNNGEPKCVFMHRAIIEPDEGMMVDHIDGDGLNNRRANLRQALPRQNSWNARVQKRSKTGLKGVSFHKRDKVWVAEIMTAGVKTRLGRFDNPEDAHAAYAVAAEKARGEFARVRNA